MKKYGAYELPYGGRKRYAAEKDEGGLVLEDRTRVEGFPTPSKRLEFYAPTMKEWGFDSGSVPGYDRSQVHWSQLDLEAGQRALLPPFPLPTPPRMSTTWMEGGAPPPPRSGRVGSSIAPFWLWVQLSSEGVADPRTQTAPARRARSIATSRAW